MIPEELLYSEEHVWVKQEGPLLRIVITEFAQDELGDVVFVELPDVEDELVFDEPFGSVESVKTVSELYAPISGRVVEINEALEENPERINTSPYEDAWLVVIEPTDESELEELLTDVEYEALTKE